MRASERERERERERRTVSERELRGSDLKISHEVKKYSSPPVPVGH